MWGALHLLLCLEEREPTWTWFFRSVLIVSECPHNQVLNVDLDSFGHGSLLGSELGNERSDSGVAGSSVGFSFFEMVALPLLLCLEEREPTWTWLFRSVLVVSECSRNKVLNVD